MIRFGLVSTEIRILCSEQRQEISVWCDVRFNYDLISPICLRIVMNWHDWKDLTPRR